jgi:hypothetical protein
LHIPAIAGSYDRQTRRLQILGYKPEKLLLKPFSVKEIRALSKATLLNKYKKTRTKLFGFNFGAKA